MIPGNDLVADPGLVAMAPGSGVIQMHPVSVCHQVSTMGQRPPADEFLIPHPGLWVDGLADGAEQAEATEVVALGVFLAPLHEGADGERSTEVRGRLPMRSTTSGGNETR